MAKIVIIGSYAGSLVSFRGNLIKEMADNGHEVIACAPNASNSIKEKLNELGATYHDIGLNGSGMNILRDLRSLKNMYKSLKIFKPDIVLTYTIKPNVYGSICARLAKVPMVGLMITGLGHPFSDSAGKLLKTIATLLYRLAITKKQVVFFQNRDDMEMFLDKRIVNKSNRLVLVNGSGVDTSYFSAKELPDNVSFLVMSAFKMEKGVREYAEAARKLKNKYPDVRFFLAGRLKEDRFHISQEELNQWIEEGSVECLGFVEDVRNLLEETFVLVLPSYYREGIPRSILEALAMARPVITTDAPGCRETVVDGVNGFLVPARDSEALAKAMERFILQPKLGYEMGVASRRLAENKFDVHKVNRVILDNLGLLCNFQ